MAFSTVHNNKHSTDQLNVDLDVIFKWTHHWKMLLNPEPEKQVQEVIFRKIIKTIHPFVVFSKYIMFQWWVHSPCESINQSEFIHDERNKYNQF